MAGPPTAGMPSAPHPPGPTHPGDLPARRGCLGPLCGSTGTVGALRYGIALTKGRHMPDKEVRLVQHRDSSANEFSASRGKGLEAASMEPAQGVTIVPDGTPSPTEQPAGPAVPASEAATGPADFDG